ncbi:DUF2312 domain-containing protein [Rickettsiales endosymbiont of Trichoplax sp. H2]|uniref:DUF2312 domain-containing protein n=1 Tax=Rickettsiales endosymbiont of Trichoplax sp. H2 TaxID=2021221 RepID=UPI0012B19443|nr:GapR family DNA-binding domain-containing protein [Rickettsiales endosymbiont of Trichoplax sp. H2]MSO14613.1 UPF0335 protein [Rickettsiales endosymbiont of Trichoplax sp. H2]
MTNKEELLKIITKLERLEEEKVDILQEVSETLASARSRGYDIKILRQILKLRKIDDEDRIKQEKELDAYKAIIGMQ